LIKACAWINDDGIEMHFGKLKSGSVYSDKRTGRLSAKAKVSTIDLAQFIKENFKTEDEIWLKMNIEGAEYKVIPHLEAEGALAWIDRMYVKWHVSKIPSVTIEEHLKAQAMVPDSIHKWRCDDVLPLVKK